MKNFFKALMMMTAMVLPLASLNAKGGGRNTIEDKVPVDNGYSTTLINATNKRIITTIYQDNSRHHRVGEQTYFAVEAKGTRSMTGTWLYQPESARTTDGKAVKEIVDTTKHTVTFE